MKLRLWHGILPKNGQCLLGTKKSKIMPNVGFEVFLSLPFTFPVLVNENPFQIYTKNNQISIFNFFSPKFGAFPILQECPHKIVTVTKYLLSQNRERQKIVGFLLL